MTELTVRRLLIDLETPLPLHWHGGDAFRTAFSNALSMSFPAGEQFFIDAVRDGVRALPADQRERLAAEVQGFIGQEATHRRVHSMFNAQLERQGLVNAWQERIERRRQKLVGLDPRHAVGATAATEHLTAILANWMLRHPQWFDGTEARLATMWNWHASEESEHRSTAFDVYTALGGNHRWRVRWMRIVTVFFVADVMRQTIDNLRRSGAFWHWRTWRSAWAFLFGRAGLVRCTFSVWRDYFSSSFHPSQHDGSQGRQWLAEHAGAYTPVG